jgi:hypothetical protein
VSDVFDPYEQALLWAGSDMGIVVAPDEQMHVVAVNDTVVDDSVGDPADTLTAHGGVVFWFGSTDSRPAVNRMATLNLFAAARLSAWTVPLLHGPVLITGVDHDGKPIVLSQAQLQLLRSGAGPNRWATMILQARERRAERRRRARKRA